MSLFDPAPNDADGFGWWRSTSALGRARRNLLLFLLLLAGGAWVLTIYHSLNMGAPIGSAIGGALSADGMEGMAMGGMSAAGWSFGGAVVFVGVWTVMMAAMMLPAAAPMILIFASAQARREHAAAVPTWIFIAGYLFIWSAVGVIVYLLVQIGAFTQFQNVTSNALDQSTDTTHEVVIWPNEYKSGDMICPYSKAKNP